MTIRRTSDLVMILLSALLCASPAAAVQAPTGRWNVDWGNWKCTLMRQNAGETTRAFALMSTPGTGWWQLRLISGEWPEGALSNPDQLTLRLQPAGTAPAILPWVENSPAGRMLNIGRLDDDFPEALAAAQSIRVERNGEPVFEMSFANATEAIAALRECEQGVMREWGIDPAAHVALRALPRGDIARFVTNDDYPMSALREGHEGTVVVRLTVDAQGKVTNCGPVVSSGDRALDLQTCAILVERARLTPAVGANGAAVSADVVSAITWNIHP